MDPAERRDGLRPRPQEEVVGVDEDDLGPELLEDGVGQPLDRALAGDGHEGGGLDGAVGRREDAVLAEEAGSRARRR